MATLEKNREFLRQLIRRNSDRGVWAAFETQKEEDFLGMMEQYISLGLLPAERRQKIVGEASQISDPIDNPLAKWTQESALNIIGSAKTSLVQVPVGLT